MEFDQALIVLVFFAFCAGFMDSAVGGGGLVQLPALLHVLPQHSLATVFGTHKFAVLLGNMSSVFSYAKRIEIVWQLMLPIMATAFIFAFLGAWSVSLIPKKTMEYAVFFVMIVMAVYVFIRKDMGRFNTATKYGKKQVFLGVFFGGVIGFYDGVFGPGSGSLLIFVFVRCFGFDFLNASVSAKLVNLGTFSAALVFFIPSGNVLWWMAGIVGICNVAGALAGTFFALRYGSGVIRLFFLLLLSMLITRMGISLFL